VQPEVIAQEKENRSQVLDLICWYVHYDEFWGTIDIQMKKTPDRSRGRHLPLLRILSAAFGPPPSRAALVFNSKSSTSLSIDAAFAWNSGEQVEINEGGSDAWYVLCVVWNKARDSCFCNRPDMLGGRGDMGLKEPSL
jgi:hypothetical protein